MSLGGQPPATDRGVGNTNAEGLIALVDWVQLTFKNIQFSYDIIDLLGLNLEMFVVLDKGLSGWKTTYQTLEGEIKILQDGNKTTEGMTQLIMSGKGCRYFEKHSTTNWIDFFSVIMNTSVNYKRIDLAIDDFEGFFTPDKVYRKIKQKAVTSKFRKGRWIESFDLSDYEKLGTTLYCGSPGSEIQVRFYDKLKEREGKNFLVDKSIKHWVRTEVQLRDGRAEAMATLISLNSKDVGELVSGTLADYINFRVRDKKEKNKSRWKICDWWLSFLKNAERISLTIKPEEPVLEKSIDWADHQWTKTMYSMYLVFQQDMDLFYKLMEKGQSKMEIKDWKRVEQFKEKYGDLTFQEYLEKKEKTNRINDSLND